MSNNTNGGKGRGMQRFKDKVVLVTGGTRGIGRACAERFASEGAKVALCGRSKATAEEVAAAIGGETRGYGCDIADPAAVDALLKDVGEALGPVEILVNNAGITQDGLLMRMKNEHIDNVLDTNLKSAFYTSRAAARGMLKARHGRIINISSVVGVHGQAGQANYAASKAGLIGFSKSYAQEVASRNITVNIVAPGYIETDMTAGIGEEMLQKIHARIPMQRAGRSEEVAGVIAFLASEDAAYITGAVIAVDGGLGM